jgi:hypothetical protein
MPSQDEPQSQVTLTAPPPEVAELPAPSPSAAHAQVEAPFVFRASDLPPSPPDLAREILPFSRATSPSPLLTMAEPPSDPQPRQGVMGKVKGFFASIFK